MTTTKPKPKSEVQSIDIIVTGSPMTPGEATARQLAEEAGSHGKNGTRRTEDCFGGLRKPS